MYPVPAIRSRGDGALRWYARLVSSWSLDEVTGTRFDAHGANNLAESAAIGSATGKLGLSTNHIAAASRYLSVASNSTLQTGDINWTISLWFKAVDISLTTILAGKDNVTADREWQIGLTGSKPQLIVWNGNTTQVGSLTWGSALNSATWYHLTFGHDAINARLWVSVNNATPQTAATTGAPGAGGAPLRVGGRPVAPASYFGGNIDEFNFWKRLVGKRQRSALYNGGSGLAYPFT